jgi:hypothetical protein
MKMWGGGGNFSNLHNERDMSEEGGNKFLWNAPNREPASEVLSDLAARHTKEPLADQISAGVVEISSAIGQLVSSYTKGDQRKELADGLRHWFIELQRLVGQCADWETRTRLTQFLVLVGALGSSEVAEEVEKPVFVFLEAVATRKHRCWVDCFYKAAHGIATYDSEGKHLRYKLTDELLTELQTAHDELLRWLES